MSCAAGVGMYVDVTALVSSYSFTARRCISV